MIRLYLFGPPRIERHGQTVPLGRTRALALIALLAVEPQPRDRSTLLALLWPEFDEASARNNLRRELSLLRSALGMDVLVADRRQVRWNPEVEAWVDVVAFRGAAAAALPAPPGEARAVKLTAAAELYAAEFLAGFTLPDSPAFDEWQFFQRESLHQLYGQVLEQLVAEHTASGSFGAAIPFARRWAALDPLHEPAQRTLIRLYAWDGQHAAAVRQYEMCARLLREELDADPEDETLALSEAIRTRRLAPPARPSPQKALAEAPPLAPSEPRPVDPAAFVGRDAELEQVTRLLVGEPFCRLLTLTGPGGIGKTRLALEAAASFADIFPDGVHIIELAPLADPALIPQTVAGALDVPEAGDQPALAAIVSALRGRRALLVLDNCEHLVDAAAQLAEAILRGCPHVRLLLTSRETLGIAGEAALPLRPLAVPDVTRLPPPDALARCESVRLFVARARAALPGFALTPENAAAVARVCAQLDGIPLAIELAAARVRLLDVEQIAARLGDRFRLLTNGSRTALPRHQTLRALIDWSYELLAEPERALLRALSVYAGGWAVEAVEALGVEALDLLGRLVNKSLVAVDHEGGAARYRMLETIRQYAHDRLLEAGEVDGVRRRHLAHTLAIVGQAEAALRGPDQIRWLDRLQAEHGNLRAAFEWALANDVAAALRLASALQWFWHLRGHKREGREWLGRALAHAGGAPPARARAMQVAGFLAQMQGDVAQATALLEESLALLNERPGDDHTRAAVLTALGGLLLVQGDAERAAGLLEDGRACFHALGDRFGRAECLGGLGRIALFAGDAERARVLWEERLALSELIGDADGIADARANLGLAAYWQGDYRTARALYAESLTSFAAIGNRWAAGFTSVTLAEVAHAEGDDAEAAALLAEALAIGRDLGDRNIIAGALVALGSLARSRGDAAVAAARYAEALPLLHALGHADTVSETLCALGDLALVSGDEAAAEAHLSAALDLGRMRGDAAVSARALLALAKLAHTRGELSAHSLAAEALERRRAAGRTQRSRRRTTSDRWEIPAFVEALALLSAAHHEWDHAARLIAATEAWHAAVRHTRPLWERDARERCRAAAGAALGRAAFALAWEDGRRLSLDEAADLAMGRHGSVARAGAAMGGSSHRLAGAARGG